MIADVEALITRKSNEGINFGFKMLAKLSAEARLSQSRFRGSLVLFLHTFEQDMFFWQDSLSPFS